MSSYQIYTLAGDPAALGRLQAEQVRSLPHPIRAPRAPWADDEAFLERCAADLRAVAPSVSAEIAAFAARVGVSPARGLFLRAGTLPHGCSAFAYAHPSLAPLQGRRPLASSRARAELMRRLPPTGADPWRAAQFVLADHSAPVCAHREHDSTLW